MKKQLLLTALLGLASAAALAETEQPTLDTDGDGTISADEYYGSVDDHGIYPHWDKDNDGYLDQDEYGAIEPPDEIILWDMNTDGLLDAEEYHRGVFEAFDEDKDGQWSPEEWKEAGEAGFWDR